MYCAVKQSSALTVLQSCGIGGKIGPAFLENIAQRKFPVLLAPDGLVTQKPSRQDKLTLGISEQFTETLSTVESTPSTGVCIFDSS